MALRRFYIHEESVSGDTIVIRGELFHHIREVCRFSVGDRFEVLAGNHEAWLVETKSVSNKELAAFVVSKRELPQLPKPLITLALSIPKLPKVDWIVEKSVELGVFEIRPFLSDFSYLRSSKDISQNRMQRWQNLVRAATQQSGRGDLMRMAAPTSFENLLEEFNRSPSTGGLFPYEGEARLSLPAALSSLKERKLDHLWVFVGSEGGFSNSEVDLFASSGLNPVSMGEQILRVETACLAIVSIIKYEMERDEVGNGSI